MKCNFITLESLVYYIYENLNTDIKNSNNDLSCNLLKYILTCAVQVHYYYIHM